MKNNFKKIMSKIKKTLLKLKNKDTSFFILVLCVCIISTSIIWTYSKKNNDVPEPISLEDEEDTDDSLNATSLMDDYIKKIKDEYDQSLKNEIENSGPDLYSIAAPLAGTIIKEYSIDKLVYFETIEEWRVHTGIDIAPKDSLKVYSAYGGKIEKINCDTLMGIEVIVDHGGGIKTLYSCLSVCKVKEGDVIGQGDQIGTIGQCEGIEMSNGPHLHFEISVDGDTVNPLDYFPNEEN